MTPQQLTNRLNEAIAHHNSGRLDRAEAVYRQLAPLAPNAPLLFQLWGQTAEQQGRVEDAVQYYSRACRLDPAAVTTAVRLSGALIALGRLSDAEEVMTAMTRRFPENAEAWNGLGFVHKLKARLAEAVACHRKAVELNPRYVAGFCHLGLTLGSMGKNSEAVQQFERALAIDPGSTLARYGRAQALHKVYRLEESVADYDAVLKANPRNLDARSYRLFVLEHLDSASPEQLFREHVAYGRAVGGAQSDFAGHDFSPEKRLRVGVVSPDLRTHSCAYFLEPLLRHLDAARFEVFLYHDHFLQDETSARLRALCSGWRNVVGQSHESVERVIRADKLDIAIDLAAHVGNSIRLPIFARRVAPVQITYLGYPDTTGVPAMDYRFTDAVADPEGQADELATEKLVRFAPVAWAYQAPADAPAVVPPPSSESGAPVVFGCFNNPTKFSDALYRCWAEILRQVPGSRMLLKGRDVEELRVKALLEERMRKAGIPLERVEWIPRTRGTREHLEQYARIDIALDTFPYNGTTTTCEALWMGRPVVTVAGARHAARVGASLLTATGHPELIAATTEDYVRKAVGLASGRTALAALSAGLRSEMQCSALCDHPGQSARFAAALRACWAAAPVSAAGLGESMPVETR